MASLTWFAWHEKATVESTMRAVGAAARESALAAKNVQETTIVWRRASQEQTSEITAVARSANAAVQRFSASSSKTLSSLTALSNELTQVAKEQNAEASLTQEQARANLRDLQAATEELKQALRDTDSQITNPAIAETIQNLDESTKTAAEGLGEATKSLTDVRQVADKFRETYLKPVNILWATVEKILGIGPPIVTAIK